MRVAPNRLVSGEALSFFALLQGTVWGLAVLLVGLLLLSLAPPRRVYVWLTVAAATALAVGLGTLAASHATEVVQASAPFARTSLGSGLWLAWLLLGLVLADALQALRAATLARLGVATAALLPLALLLVSGAADELSIMKEYANRSDEYWGVIARHCQIVALALLFTLAVGLPLGWVTHRYARVGRAMFPLLNIVQTIPSIALFGLLMAPLAWLAGTQSRRHQRRGAGARRIGINALQLAAGGARHAGRAGAGAIGSHAGGAGFGLYPRAIVLAGAGAAGAARGVEWRAHRQHSSGGPGRGDSADWCRRPG